MQLLHSTHLDATKLFSTSVDGWESMWGVGTFHSLQPLAAYLDVLIKTNDTTILEQTINRSQLALTNVGGLDAQDVKCLRQQLAQAKQFLKR